MIYLFTPYYNPDMPEFIESLAKQTVEFKRITRDRKKDGIYWTKAMNDFRKELKRYRGVRDTDIVCVMNNDISFPPDYLQIGSKVKEKQIFTHQGITVDWKKKKFYDGSSIHTFPGRAFFMTAKDFKKYGYFSKLLPHYLSDYDFGLRMVKKGFGIYEIVRVVHVSEQKWNKTFEIINPANPIFWTIFLLKHPNKYTLINILRAWFDAIR